MALENAEGGRGRRAALSFLGTRAGCPAFGETPRETDPRRGGI